MSIQVGAHVFVLYFVLFILGCSIMENRSVVATGLRSDMTYEDLTSLFKAAGDVQKIVRVIGPDLKYTDRAYVVYDAEEAVTQASMQLSKGGIKVQALGSDKTRVPSIGGR